MTNKSTFLDPEVLDKVAGLEFKARGIVEGYVSGLHRSPFHGFSVEFAEHREYVPGDDLRFLDWKVFGRTDRLYIKRYEEETNLEAHILLDCSESMTYRSHEGGRPRGGPTKFEYATWAAAALGWLITNQQDAVGLVLFDEEVREVVPAQSNLAHFRTLISRLEAARPAGGTSAGRALAQAAEAVRRRGVVVLFSDLLDDPHEVARGLKQLRQQGHDVLIFHVLDHDEVTFPFERLTRFEGLEGLPQLTADPIALRAAYLEEVEAFRRSLRRICRANRIDLVPMDTSDSLAVVLSAYLARRADRQERR